MNHREAYDPHLVLAALIFLQVQFAQQRRPGIADAIADHLERLESMSDALPYVLARALPRLRSQWCAFQIKSRLTTSPACVRHPLSGVVVPFPGREARQ